MLQKIKIYYQKWKFEKRLKEEFEKKEKERRKLITQILENLKNKHYDEIVEHYLDGAECFPISIKELKEHELLKRYDGEKTIEKIVEKVFSSSNWKAIIIEMPMVDDIFISFSYNRKHK